jgi:hypothetical protein
MRATPLTAKTGRIMAGNSKRVDSRLLVIGKKTGNLMGIMLVTTGRSMERIITTAAAIGAEDMEDTRRGECWQAWRSALC